MYWANYRIIPQHCESLQNHTPEEFDSLLDAEIFAKTAIEDWLV